MPTDSGKPWVLIVGNPFSGSGANRQRADELSAALSGHGFDTQIVWSRTHRRQMLSDPSQLIGCRCVVIAGGDGTVRDVICERPPVPVAILPLGVENLLSKALGLGREPVNIAGCIAAGVTRRIDLGGINDSYFSLMVSAGFDAKVVHDVTRWRRSQGERLRRLKRSSYIVPILESLAGYNGYDIDLTIDDDRTIRGAMVLISNVSRYALNLKFVPGSKDDDGYLDWIVFQNPSLGALIKYGTALALGTHTRLPDVQFGRTRHATIRSQQSVPIQIDGDPAGHTPAEIQIKPLLLEIIVNPTTPN